MFKNKFKILKNTLCYGIINLSMQEIYKEFGVYYGKIIYKMGENS